MSYKLQFVADDLSTVRLSLYSSTISHIESETDIPLPKHQKVWTGAGRKRYGELWRAGSWPNITLTLSFAIKASTVALMDAAVRDLVTEITRDNWLEFQPEGGSSLFYRTFAYDGGDPGTLQKKVYRLNKLTWGFKVQLQALPLPRGAKQTLAVARNLAPNWLFASLSGSDFDGWAETSSDGSVSEGHATYDGYESSAYDGFYGSLTTYNVKLTTTDAGGYAQIETVDFIAVTNTRHFFLASAYYGTTGTALDICIDEYDVAGNLLQTKTFEPTAHSRWALHSVVVHPKTETTETNYWHADTTKIKIRYRVDGAVATWLIGMCYFTDSEYLTGNEAWNALGIDLAPADLLGDMPAPVDIYIDGAAGGHLQAIRLYVGQKEEYKAGFDPIAGTYASYGGAIRYDGLAPKGVAYTKAPTPNKFCNPSFEEVTGSGNSSAWTGLTASRQAGIVLEDCMTDAHWGRHCLHINNPTAAEITGNSYVIDTNYVTGLSAGVAWALELWYKTDYGADAWGGELALVLNFYDSSNVALTSGGSGNIQQGTVGQWRRITASGTTPASCAKMKVQVSAAYVAPGANIWVDDVKVTFGGSSVDEKVAAVRLPVDDYEGRYLVIPSMAFNVSGGSGHEIPHELEVKSRLLDSSGNEIVPEEWLGEGSFWGGPSTFYFFNFYDSPRLAPLTVPAAGCMDAADLSYLLQEITIQADEDLSSSVAGVATGGIVLLPIDGAFCEILAGYDRTYIIDSRSEGQVSVLKSYDGTLNKAVQANGTAFDISGPFTLDPQNGSQIVVLECSHGRYGHPVVPFADITLEYNPLYLVVV